MKEHSWAESCKSSCGRPWDFINTIRRVYLCRNKTGARCLSDIKTNLGHDYDGWVWYLWMWTITLRQNEKIDKDQNSRDLRSLRKAKKKGKKWNHLISHPYLSGRYCNLWSLLQSLWAELGYVPHMIMSYYLPWGDAHVCTRVNAHPFMRV